jgi:hypothetical protein
MEEEVTIGGGGRGASDKGREADLELGFERRGPSVEGVGATRGLVGRSVKR